VVVPFVVIIEFMPVARPLNSWAVTIWALVWTENAARNAAPIQREKKVSLPLFIRVLLQFTSTKKMFVRQERKQQVFQIARRVSAVTFKVIAALIPTIG
jgi:hypothetical protein